MDEKLNMPHAVILTASTKASWGLGLVTSSWSYFTEARRPDHTTHLSPLGFLPMPGHYKLSRCCAAVCVLWPTVRPCWLPARDAHCPVPADHLVAVHCGTHWGPCPHWRPLHGHCGQVGNPTALQWHHGQMGDPTTLHGHHGQVGDLTSFTWTSWPGGWSNSFTWTSWPGRWPNNIWSFKHLLRPWPQTQKPNIFTGHFGLVWPTQYFRWTFCLIWSSIKLSQVAKEALALWTRKVLCGSFFMHYRYI